MNNSELWNFLNPSNVTTYVALLLSSVSSIYAYKFGKIIMYSIFIAFIIFFIWLINWNYSVHANNAEELRRNIVQIMPDNINYKEYIEVPKILNKIDYKEYLFIPFKININKPTLKVKFKINKREIIDDLIKNNQGKLTSFYINEEFGKGLIMDQGEYILNFPFKGVDIKSSENKITIEVEIFSQKTSIKKFNNFFSIKNNEWNFDVSLNKHVLLSSENTKLNININNKTSYSSKFRITTKLIKQNSETEFPIDNNIEELSLEGKESNKNYTQLIELKSDGIYRLEVGVNKIFEYCNNEKNKFCLHNYNKKILLIEKGKITSSIHKKQYKNIAILDAKRWRNKDISIPIQYMLKDNFKIHEVIKWRNKKFNKNFLYYKINNKKEISSIQNIIYNYFSKKPININKKDTTSKNIQKYFKNNKNVDYVLVLGAAS